MASWNINESETHYCESVTQPAKKFNYNIKGNGDNGEKQIHMPTLHFVSISYLPFKSVCTKICIQIKCCIKKVRSLTEIKPTDKKGN